MTVRNRLKKIRHELEIDTQEEMAALLGIGRQQYNRFEQQRAQPSLETVLRIAKKLNKPVEEIVALED